MVHGAGEMLVENERYAAGLTEAAIGKTDAVSFDKLRRRRLVCVGGQGISPSFNI
jgi:hypothetical protein